MASGEVIANVVKASESTAQEITSGAIFFWQLGGQPESQTKIRYHLRNVLNVSQTVPFTTSSAV